MVSPLVLLNLRLPTSGAPSCTSHPYRQPPPCATYLCRPLQPGPLLPAAGAPYALPQWCDAAAVLAAGVNGPFPD
ncbi:hypothetical protein BS78_K119400 [Paspalum vaginatum]|uniref:Secreted protein n=1 Tax=Paspalum vaginatum TaxID=158149 RepID=A0A9W8CFU9_9POAL|nr:hypothetical protein BS78_K119400 [Paspalum vaginatum]